MKIFSKKEYIWEEEANALLKKVPFFARRFAQARVEELVQSQGRFDIRAEDVERARRAFLRDIEQQEKSEKKDSEDSSRMVLYQVDVCKGKALGCPFGLVDTQWLAQRVIALLEELQITEFLLKRTDGLLLPHHKIKVAIAGCPNSCHQPQIKDFGVIAHESVVVDPSCECSLCMKCLKECREGAITIMEDRTVIIHQEKCVKCGLCARVCHTGSIKIDRVGYSIVLGGKVGRHPRFALQLMELATEEQVIKALEICAEKILAENGRNLYGFLAKESFHDKLGEALKEVI